ncbi:MAG: RNA polymerase sigma factor [Polyangiaceae bacterium]
MNPLPEDELGGAVQASWRRFLEIYEPLRPELYRYCRHLTRSPWDAEDMAQETLTKAFVALGIMTEPPRNPKAWLFRVASNLWINRSRQQRELLNDSEESSPATSSDPRTTREAAGTVIAQLSPQERVAVVLKDAFGLSLDEVAEALSTTSGAIKAALHRGRAKLVEPEPVASAAVPPAVLDAFCEAFNARDLDRLTALLLDTTTMEFPGLRIEYGKEAVRSGSLGSTLFGCPEGEHAPSSPVRCERRTYRTEWIFLWWWGEEVHAVIQVDVCGDRIAKMRDYHHSPEVIAEVCREIDVPFRTHGYHPRG